MSILLPRVLDTTGVRVQIIHTEFSVRVGDHDLTRILWENGRVFGFLFEKVYTAHKGLFGTRSSKGHDSEQFLRGLPDIECKTLTEHGVVVAESGHTGTGRVFDPATFERDALFKTFAIGDTQHTRDTDGREIRFVEMSGAELLNLRALNGWNTSRLPASSRNVLFGMPPTRQSPRSVRAPSLDAYDDLPAVVAEQHHLPIEITCRIGTRNLSGEIRSLLLKGAPLGFLFEALCVSMLGGRQVQADDYDLLHEHPIECKIVSQGGGKLYPSRHSGMKRSFTTDDLERLRLLAPKKVYALCDQPAANQGQMHFVLDGGGHLLERFPKAHFSYNGFQRYLGSRFAVDISNWTGSDE